MEVPTKKPSILKQGLAFFVGLLLNVCRQTAVQTSPWDYPFNPAINPALLQNSMYREYIDIWKKPTRPFPVVLREAFSISGMPITALLTLERSLYGKFKCPFYSKKRLEILSSVLEAAIRVNDTFPLIYQLHDACEFCIGRHKEVFEKLINYDSPANSSGREGAAILVSDSVSRFLDEFKRDALTCAFISPLKYIYRNSPETLDNLESHGRSFWASLMEAMTGIQMPYEDISAMDSGWAWAARDFLKIMLKYPQLDFTVRNVIWSRKSFGASEIKKSEDFAVKFSKFSFFFPFVKSGTPEEFAEFLAAVKFRKLSSPTADLLAEYCKIFTGFFEDRELVARRLIDYLITRPLPGVSEAAEMLGIPLTSLVTCSEESFNYSYEFDQLHSLLNICRIRLFTPR